MKIAIWFASIVFCLFLAQRSDAQAVINHSLPITVVADQPIDTAICKDTVCAPMSYKNEVDLKDLGGDLWHDITHKEVKKRVDTGEVVSTKLHVNAVPAAGYSLATGLAGLLAANAVFRTNLDANNSTMVTSFTYTIRNQIILPLLTSIWTKENKYDIVTDWRYVKFPSYTYGLGGYTTLADGYEIDYSAIRLHTTILRKIKKSFYAGIGYNMDYFYNVKEINPPSGGTDFQKYELDKVVHSQEFASGITFNLLYDNRVNTLNPEKGSFWNVIYRTNVTSLGNEFSWRSLVIDGREYMKFPAYSNNVLAFWTYEWFTLDGQAPYLMMPNTGGDPYSNTGRGYILGRFRGSNMLYAETEYRFQITNNGLIGGVVFANAESVTEPAPVNRFETVAPGWGAGIRLKLDKFSRTNVALDYGFGLGGSGGLFVNIGEVF